MLQELFVWDLAFRAWPSGHARVGCLPAIGGWFPAHWLQASQPIGWTSGPANGLAGPWLAQPHVGILPTCMWRFVGRWPEATCRRTQARPGPGRHPYHCGPGGPRQYGGTAAALRAATVPPPLWRLLARGAAAGRIGAAVTSCGRASGPSAAARHSASGGSCLAATCSV